MLCLKETERLHFIVDIIYFFMFLHKGKRTILILKCVRHKSNEYFGIGKHYYSKNKNKNNCNKFILYIKWVRKIIHMQIQFSQNRPHVSTLIWQFSLTLPFLALCLQDWTGIQRHEGWPHGADEWSSLPLPQQALTKNQPFNTTFLQNTYGSSLALYTFR